MNHSWNIPSKTERQKSSRMPTTRQIMVRVKNNSDSWIKWYLLAVFVASLIHLLLGTSLVTIVLALCAVVLSVVPAMLYGWRDIPALLCAAAGLQYTAFSLFWKLFEGSPFDSGLYSPQMSLLVILVGTLGQISGVLAARFVWPRQSLFRERYSSYSLSIMRTTAGVLSVVALAIGFSHFQLLGGLTALLNDRWIAFPATWLALNYRTKSDVFSPSLLATMILFMALSLVGNSRASILSLVTAMLLFSVCYRTKVQPLMVVFSVGFLAFFVTVVSPSIVDVRDLRETTSGAQMLGATMEQIGARLTGKVQDQAPDPSGLYQLNYFKSQNNLLTRVAVLPELDFIVSKSLTHGLIGTSRFYQAIPGILPSFVNSDKSAILDVDYKMWVYGVLTWGLVSMLEVTPFGDAYTSGGFVFLFVAMFIQFSLIFIFFRLFCQRFDRSLFSVFLVTAYGHVFTGGGALLLAPLFRTMPFELAFFWMLGRLRPGTSVFGQPHIWRRRVHAPTQQSSRPSNKQDIPI